MLRFDMTPFKQESHKVNYYIKKILSDRSVIIQDSDYYEVLNLILIVRVMCHLFLFIFYYCIRSTSPLYYQKNYLIDN